MEGDVITLQDIFVFDFSAGVDEEGRFRGRLKSTGLRPKFLDKLAERGVYVDAEMFALRAEGPALMLAASFWTSPAAQVLLAGMVGAVVVRARLVPAGDRGPREEGPRGRPPGCAPSPVEPRSRSAVAVRAGHPGWIPERVTALRPAVRRVARLQRAAGRRARGGRASASGPASSSWSRWSAFLVGGVLGAALLRQPHAGAAWSAPSCGARIPPCALRMALKRARRRSCASSCPTC